MKEELLKKVINQIDELCRIADLDLQLHGNCYIEFGERSLKVIKPENIIIDSNGNLKERFYGESIIKVDKNG